MAERASSVAGQYDALYGYIAAIAIFFSALVAILIFYFAVKFRRRHPLEIPRPNAGSLALETMWTVVPFLIAMTIFAWGSSLYFTLYRQPKEAIEIFVVGKQWMWKFQHTEGQREINELHVPVGSRVKLTMTTEDVIHSFAVPAFRVRSDVVPGRYTYAWFEATKTGRYHLFCSEYCGTNHSGMNGFVEVMDPTAYQTWLAGGGSDSPAATGEKLFQSTGCATCHRLDTQGRGPNLTGVYGKPQQLADGTTVTADDAYVRESILNPRAKTVAGFQQIMPTYQGQLSEEQVLQLIAYIRSLGAPETGGTAGARSQTSGTQTTSGAVAPDSQRSNPLAPTQPAGGTGSAGGAPRTQVNAGGGNRNGGGGAARRGGGNSNQ
ncbi:MAG TPA: cytochrome c oxidase subunit II [Pyrinomonadaceae bacterium]|jgi:cytochrome c oxidase subunit 2